MPRHQKPLVLLPWPFQNLIFNCMERHQLLKHPNTRTSCRTLSLFSRKGAEATTLYPAKYLERLLESRLPPTVIFVRGIAFPCLVLVHDCRVYISDCTLQISKDKTIVFAFYIQQCLGVNLECSDPPSPMDSGKASNRYIRVSYSSHQKRRYCLSNKICCQEM